MSTNSVATADRVLIERRLRDWLLFPLSVSSGAVDVISFLALGKVFTAAMSGNFALLGIGIAGDAGAPSVISVLASMAGFVVGNYVAARIATPYPGEQPTVVVWPRGTTLVLRRRPAPPPLFRGNLTRDRWQARHEHHTRSPGCLGTGDGNTERCGSMPWHRWRIYDCGDRHFDLFYGRFSKSPGLRRREAPIVWRACLRGYWRDGRRVSSHL